MSFGSKLKELRQAAGLTQTQLADVSGVPVGTIRDYEQSKRDPLLSSAQRLAKGLDVSMTAFEEAGPSGDRPPPATEPKPRGRPRKTEAPAAEPAPTKKPRRKRS